MKKIITILSSRSAGYTRSELINKSGLTDGGTLSSALKALEISDFINHYVPFGAGKREVRYKLTDPFCIFYLRFVANRKDLPDTFWQQNIITQEILSWRGYAFENICFNHIGQIKNALGIRSVSSTESAWSKRADDTEGAQIDMIISRKDNVVNMCEIKFYSDQFAVDKDDDMTIRRRKTLLSEYLSPKQIIHSTLITTFGLKYNTYSGIFDNVITLDDIFK